MAARPSRLHRLQREKPLRHASATCAATAAHSWHSAAWLSPGTCERVEQGGDATGASQCGSLQPALSDSLGAPAGTPPRPHLRQAVPQQLQLAPQVVHPGAVRRGRLAQHPVRAAQPLRQPAQRQQQARAWVGAGKVVHACSGRDGSWPQCLSHASGPSLSPTSPPEATTKSRRSSAAPTVREKKTSSAVPSPGGSAAASAPRALCSCAPTASRHSAAAMRSSRPYRLPALLSTLISAGGCAAAAAAAGPTPGGAAGEAPGGCNAPGWEAAGARPAPGTAELLPVLVGRVRRKYCDAPPPLLAPAPVAAAAAPPACAAADAPVRALARRDPGCAASSCWYLPMLSPEMRSSAARSRGVSVASAAVPAAALGLFAAPLPPWAPIPPSTPVPQPTAACACCWAACACCSSAREMSLKVTNTCSR